MSTIKIGALCWNQHGDWDTLLEAGRRVDRLGYDSLWTWDEYPSCGRATGGPSSAHTRGSANGRLEGQNRNL